MTNEDIVQRLPGNVRRHTQFIYERASGISLAFWQEIVRDFLSAADRLEALEAEVERLKSTSLTLGVGDGDGQLFVHGDYDSIKAAQAYIFRAEAAEAEVARLRTELEEAKK